MFELFCLFAVLASAGKPCDNPVIEFAREFFPAGTANFYNESRSHEDYSVCQFLNGKDACCSKEVMDAAARAYEAVKGITDEAERGLRQTWDEIKRQMGFIWGADINRLFDEMFNAMKNIYRPMYRHAAALMCHVCDEDWAVYWNAEHTQMHLAQAACDAFYAEGFAPVINSINRFFTKAFGMGLVEVKICEDNVCKEWICDTVFAGNWFDLQFSFGKPSTIDGKVHYELPARSIPPENAATSVWVSTGGLDTATVGSESGMTGTESGAGHVVVSALLLALLFLL